MRTIKQIERDIASTKIAMAPYETRLRELLVEKEKVRREEREQKRSKAHKQAKQREGREARAREQFKDVKPGDMVRLRGTRDSKNPWRLVARVDGGQKWNGYGRPSTLEVLYVYGQKFGRNKDGTWKMFNQHTKNGIEKIAELIPAKEVNLVLT